MGRVELVNNLLHYVQEQEENQMPAMPQGQQMQETVSIEEYLHFQKDAGYGTLYISKDDFLRGQAVELTEGMVKNLQGFDYLNIAHAKYLLKLHFDSLEVMIVRNEHGEPIFDLPDGRGSLVGVFLQNTKTGYRSAVTWFPVMGRSRKGAIKPAEIDPDARCLNDNLARAIVKCIAFTVGIGFDLYSRLEEEDLIEAEEGAAAVRGSTKAEKKKARVIEPEEEDDDDEEEEDDDDDDDEEEEEQPKSRRRSFPSARTSSSRRKA